MKKYVDVNFKVIHHRATLKKEIKYPKSSTTSSHIPDMHHCNSRPVQSVARKNVIVLPFKRQDTLLQLKITFRNPLIILSKTIENLALQEQYALYSPTYNHHRSNHNHVQLHSQLTLTRHQNLWQLSCFTAPLVSSSVLC